MRSRPDRTAGGRRRSRGRPLKGPSKTLVSAPRVFITALASGLGKTTVAAGLCAALRQQGRSVVAFKAGPDFLDAQVLRRASGGGPVRNLDLWLSTVDKVESTFDAHAPSGPSGLSIIEGAMGLFDTSSWGTSSLDIAKLLQIPLVLVVDASASAESVAAGVRGTRAMLPPGLLKGVIINKAGRGWHASTVRKSVERWGRTSVLGVLPWDAEVRLPERYLGLITPDTDPGRELDRRLRSLGKRVADAVDLGSVVDIAEAAAPRPLTEPVGMAPQLGGTVALASDPAFCFIYPETREAFESRGSRVRLFSPLRGDPIPPSADVVVLPGGYPELHAVELSDQTRLLSELRAWVLDGRPLYGECGGMMVLMKGMTTADGRYHAMAGALPGSTRMGPRLGGFGYVGASVLRASIWGRPRSQLRGHVYHHSVREDPPIEPWALRIMPRRGGAASHDGYARGGTAASYLHLRLDGYPHVVERLLQPNP